MSNQTLDNSAIAGFCGDDVNIPRVFIAQFGGTSLQCNDSLTLEPDILSPEIKTTDMTITDSSNVMNLLESAVQASIIENEYLSPVLIQVCINN